MWMTLSEFSPCVFYWEKKWIKEKEKGKRGMRHYHLHPSGLRCSNLLNITVTFASRSRKGWSSSLIGIEYSIDRSLCHVTHVVGSGFGGESTPHKKIRRDWWIKKKLFKQGTKNPGLWSSYEHTYWTGSIHSYPIQSIPYNPTIHILTLLSFTIHSLRLIQHSCTT